MLVRVALPDGGETALKLQQSLHIGGVETEARLLPVLARLGLPVAELLAGPVTDPDRPEMGPMTVLTLLPGTDLGTLCWTGSAPPPRIAWAGGLVLEAVDLRLVPFNHAGLVERYLVSRGLTLRDFAPRLAVRCLWTLQREIAVEGEQAAYRGSILGFLRQAMAWME